MSVPTHARFFLALVLCMVPLLLGAQAMPIPPGTRVRLEMHDKSRLEGTLMSQAADSVVTASPKATRTAVATEYIWRVRRSEGKSHAHGAVQGLKIGAAIAGGVSLLLMGGAYLGSSELNKDATPYAASAAAGAFTGALYGVVIGALVGAERWTTVYTTPARVSFVPSPTGMPGIGMVLRF